jgi:NADH-quinone oxidoreductase subunit N
MLALLQTSVDFSTITKQTAQLITPEVVLLIFACGILILDTIAANVQKHLLAWFSLAGVALSFVSLIVLYTTILPATNSSRTGFFDVLVIDHYAFFFKALFLIAAGVVIVLASESPVSKERGGAFFTLLLLAVVGMMFLASSMDLLLVFVSLELLALAVYVLIGYCSPEPRSRETMLRFFLLGAFSSAIFLYGVSLLYGLTGSTNLTDIVTALPIIIGKGYDPLGIPSDVRYLVLIAIVMLTVGLGFKIAAVPFHTSEPEAYEKTPTALTAFLSVGLKVAALSLIGRLFLYGLADVRGTLAGDPATNTRGVPGWAIILSIVAVLTMIWGNVAALRENRLLRLLAFSSIAQAGYVLLGLIAGNERGYSGFAIHLLAYTLMNLGAFGCLLAIRRAGITGDSIAELNGLGKRSPLLAGLLTLFVASLIGIPLTAGFIGKYNLFLGLIETRQKWLMGLAILAIVMSVVSLLYFWKLLRAMYLTKASDEAVNQWQQSGKQAESMPLRVALLFCGIMLVAIGIYPRPFTSLTTKAAAVYKTYDYKNPPIPGGEKKTVEPPMPQPPITPGAR